MPNNPILRGAELIGAIGFLTQEGKTIDISLTIEPDIEAGIRWNGDGSIGTRRLDTWGGSLTILNPSERSAEQMLKWSVKGHETPNDVKDSLIVLLEGIIGDCQQRINELKKQEL